MTWTLKVSDVTPTANKFLRTHYRVRMRMKEAWRLMMLEAGALEVPKAKGRRRVTLIRRSKRLLDEPNIYLAADKLVLDNLVAMGLLKDDNPKWLDLRVKQEKAKKPETEVTIEELPLQP